MRRSASPRRFRYVGPAELRDLPEAVDVVDVTSVEGPGRWLADQDAGDRTAPFTYVITLDGDLRVAPRCREHVACARGQDVLGAGEVRSRRVRVDRYRDLKPVQADWLPT